nr:protein tyrosine phosphatase family protein [Stenotrophomonas sp. ISL-67]
MRRWNRPAFFSACVMCLVLLAAESSGAEPRSTSVGAGVERGSAPLAEAKVPTAFKHPTKTLYTAGQPTAAQLHQSAAAGITTVIDLRQPGEARGFDETATTTALGLHYVRIPVAGAAGLTPANVQALQTALTQANGPVLLHCASGNRVGALLALMKAQQGASVGDALQFGREAGMTSLEAQTRALLEQDTAR